MPGFVLLVCFRCSTTQVRLPCVSRAHSERQSESLFDFFVLAVVSLCEYCWRRSGFFWRMRASFGLACAQATTLAAQVFGKDNPRSRAGRTSA